MTPRHVYVHDPQTLSFFTFSTHKQEPLFSDHHICDILVDRLNQAQSEKDVSIIAWVIMHEHVHMIVHLPETIAPEQFLRYVKRPVSFHALNYLRNHQPKTFDSLKVMTGRKWNHRFWKKGGGFHRNLYSMKRIRDGIDYIHNNPVKEGYVECPEYWKYSSAGWWLDRRPIPIEPRIPDWIGLVD